MHVLHKKNEPAEEQEVAVEVEKTEHKKVPEVTAEVDSFHIVLS